MGIDVPPVLAGRSDLVLQAYSFATEAHEGPRSLGTKSIAHPVEVASLIAHAGFSDEVVAASLLHDVLEHTTTSHHDLRGRFGHRVADLVLAVSEDAGIRSYAARKADLRERALRSGTDAAAIFAADKLASSRTADAQSIASDRLEHYATTLAALHTVYPDLPFLDALGVELERLGTGRT